MAHNFCYVELTTPDPSKAKQFYQKVFDWKLEDETMGGLPYTFINPGEGLMGGIAQTHEKCEAPSMWMPYVSVSNLDEYVKKAETLGAKIHVPRQEVPGFGWFVIIQDPTGAVIGLWENQKKN